MATTPAAGKKRTGKTQRLDETPSSPVLVGEVIAKKKQAAIKAVMGRPTDYTEELASTICERISDGESLKKITDEQGMPSRVTVHAWLIRYPDFLNKYEASKALQADVYADEMDDIAHNEMIDVQRARLIIDTRKWTASKLKPKKYGDKLDVTSDGERLPTPLLGGLSVQTETADNNS